MTGALPPPPRYRGLRKAPVIWIARFGFALALVVAAANFPRQAQELLEFRLPDIRLWHDPDAQFRLQLGDVPYDLLQAADAALPRDASVLLVTSGDDVRHREYTTFHRALYFLAPRPVWWLSPAAPDGAWEARWWISAPLTLESIHSVAVEKRVSHVLTHDLPRSVSIGRKIADWADGSLFQLNERAPSSAGRPALSAFAGAGWPIQVALAAFVIVLLGQAGLAGIARLGYRARGIEAAALAWALGAGLTSLGMLWLNGLGIPLGGHPLLSRADRRVLFSRAAARRRSGICFGRGRCGSIYAAHRRLDQPGHGRCAAGGVCHARGGLPGRMA